MTIIIGGAFGAILLIIAIYGVLLASGTSFEASPPPPVIQRKL